MVKPEKITWSEIPQDKLADSERAVPVNSTYRSFELPDGSSVTKRVLMQSDTYQCGPCAIFNLANFYGRAESLGIDPNQDAGEIILSLRDQLHLNLDDYFYTPHINILLGAIFANERQIAVGHGLASSNTEQGRQNLDRTIKNLPLNDYHGFITNTGHHYVAIVHRNGSWFKIDSLVDDIIRLDEEGVKGSLSNSQQYFAIRKVVWQEQPA